MWPGISDNDFIVNFHSKKPLFKSQYEFLCVIHLFKLAPLGTSNNRVRFLFYSSFDLTLKLFFKNPSFS